MKETAVFLCNSSAFMANIDDPDLVWEFTMQDGLIVTGTIVGYLMTRRGFPIVLTIKCADEKQVEIIWVEIHYINRKGNHDSTGTNHPY